jgi:hypothetical protein
LRYQAFVLDYELNKGNQEMQRLDKVEDEFLSIITHDLKTPLTVIKGYSGMMLTGNSGEVNSQQKGMLEIIWKQADAQQGLVDSILDYTRTQFGYTLKRQPLTFSALVRELAEAEKVEADKKKIEIVMDLPAEEVQINVDKAMMERVIYNLIENAIRYTPEGGKIKITLTRDENEVRLIICDTGVGIAKENLEKIFEKFFGIEITGIHDKRGLGLGLYIVRNFVTAHGGRVFAESGGPGKGSTFTVTLPTV